MSPQQFDAQVVQYIPRLRRYARALTGDRTAADDLVQDTLERAWSKLHLWRHGSDLRAWLFTIMHNVFINQVRSRSNERLVAIDETPDLPEESRSAPGEFDMHDLEAALKRLPEEQRAVLLLVGLEQLSYEETARALGIPIGTVMSRLSRARARLRSLMSGAPEGASLRVIK